MKNPATFTYFLLLFFILIFPCHLIQAQNSSSILGTYEYLLENREGMGVVTRGYMVWVLTDKNRKSFQGTQATDTEKAAAFASGVADVCSYKFVGPSRITVHRLFSTNPALVGKEFTFEYEFDGELFKYWIIQADGSREPMRTSKRIEK